MRNKILNKPNKTLTVEDARQKAGSKWCNSKASIWGFVAMVLGLVLTSIGGMVGANLVKTADHENRI